MYQPLADLLRPQTLDEVFGQEHILGKGAVLRRLIDSGNIPNMVFYGPSGTGKTTVANIIAKQTNRTLYKLNATTASTADIKEIVSQLDTFMAPNGVLLYLDEIQSFNKKQQQSLLEVIENGSVTLIASTTENPYFYVYNAILSRSAVFEFKPLEVKDILKAIRRGVCILEDELKLQIEFSDFAFEAIAKTCGGDVRKALNTLEMCVMSAGDTPDGTLHISVEMVEQASSKKAFRHDRDGDSHYDVLSAFQKSIRGSDPDAAVHYLARILAAGDLQSACRRLMVTASEDIGLAYPAAASIVKACVDSALQVGLPEARIPLCHAVLLLATAPKSNAVICAIDEAMHDIESGDTGDVPQHLKDAHYGGAKKLGRGIEYKYPHEFPNHYVKQDYLPEKLRGKKYYRPQNNKNETAIKNYWEQIKKDD